jgi:FtsZ-interacting cell division protein ZipA
MNTQLMWIIAAVAVVALVVVALIVARGRRSAQLRQRFGPEYERTLRETGDVRRTDAVLQARAARVERLHIRPLSPEDAQRFTERWRLVQAQFVDDPKAAVTEADRLVGEVMHVRGYPVGEFEQRVEDISVDHPDVVMNYRAARTIADAHARGQASTEDLRQAMVHYRALYGDLLGQARPEPIRAEVPAERAVAAGRGRR